MPNPIIRISVRCSGGHELVGESEVGCHGGAGGFGVFELDGGDDFAVVAEASAELLVVVEVE